MIRATLFVLLLLAALAPAAPAPDVYSTDVHVISSYFPPFPANQQLNVIIDGKKYELNGPPDGDFLLALGDYKAKLVKDEHKTSYESAQVYEFLFPDKKTRKFEVVGQSE
jgi:hypothetical protein